MITCEKILRSMSFLKKLAKVTLMVITISLSMVMQVNAEIYNLPSGVINITIDDTNIEDSGYFSVKTDFNLEMINPEDWFLFAITYSISNCQIYEKGPQDLTYKKIFDESYRTRDGQLSVTEIRLFPVIRTCEALLSRPLGEYKYFTKLNIHQTKSSGCYYDCSAQYHNLIKEWTGDSGNTSYTVAGKVEESPSLTANLMFNSASNEYLATQSDYSVNWSIPANAHSYDISESINDGGWVVVSNATTLKNYNAKDRLTGNKYSYKVNACNINRQCGPDSNILTVYVLPHTPPESNILTPNIGSQFFVGDTVDFKSYVSDAEGIKSVVLRSYVNASTTPSFVKTLYKNNDGDYVYSWVENNTGNIRLELTATDITDEVAVSEVHISVSDNKIPTVNISSNKTVMTDGDAVKISATPVDVDGTIQRVELWANGSLLSTINSAPYDYIWLPSIPANYSIIAKAYDNDGAVSVTSNANTLNLIVNELLPPAPPADFKVSAHDSVTQLSDNSYKNTTGSFSIEWKCSVGADYCRLESQINDQWFALTSNGMASIFNKIVDGNDTFIYRVLAGNDAGETTSAELTIEVEITKPVSPLILNITHDAAVNVGDFNLSWSASTNPSADHYFVEKKNGSLADATPWQVLNSEFSQTTYEFRNIIPSHYQYRVSACNNGGCSEPGIIKPTEVLQPHVSEIGLLGGLQTVKGKGIAIHPSASIVLTPVGNEDGLSPISFTPNQIQWQHDANGISTFTIPLNNPTFYDAIQKGVGIAVRIINPNGANSTIHLVVGQEAAYTSMQVSSVTVGLDGTLYLAANDSIYGIDPLTGETVDGWPFKTQGVIQATPILDRKGDLLVGSTDDHFYAINIFGQEKWSIKAGGDIVATAALDEDNIVYFGSLDGVVYAAHAETGQLKFKHIIGYPIAATPVLTGDGNSLFVTTQNGQLYAIGRGVLGRDSLMWDAPNDSLLADHLNADNWTPEQADIQYYLRAARLYQTVFPEWPLSREVLTFWTFALKNRASLVEASNAFLNSNESQTIPLVDSTDANFVDELYARVFPSQGQPVITVGGESLGYNDFISLLNSSETRASVTTMFSDALENLSAHQSLENSFEYFYISKYEDLDFSCETDTAYERDCDLDGLPDYWEIIHFGNIDEETATSDADNDGTSNGDAWNENTSPCTDGCYDDIIAESKEPVIPDEVSDFDKQVADEVGALAASFSVNESGAAAYNVPLSLPQGIAGVSPQLSVGYSSNGGNGLIGLGWSMGGLSSISRCRQTLGQDGEAKGIAWSEEDRFCLDGQRLIVEGGDYGKPNSTYRTEIDSYVRVTAHGGQLGDPAYFTASRKDGSISYYGNGDQSRLEAPNGYALSWAQNRFEDSAQNAITFSYEQEGGHRISKVRYADDQALVSYQYEDRLDELGGYVAGREMKTIKRLTHIIVQNNGEEFRRYDFEYMPYDAQFYDKGYDVDRLSRLDSIQESVNGITKPKTHFDWKLLTSGFNTSDATKIRLSAGSKRFASSYKPADINGDGKMDLVWIDAYWDDGKVRSQDIKYRIATGVGNESEWSEEFISKTIVQRSWQAWRLEVLDYNLDGRMDYAYFDTSKSKWIIKLAEPSSSAVGGWSLLNYEGDVIETTISTKSAQFIDINSDGLVDAIWKDGYKLMEINPLADISSNQYYRFGEKQTLTLEGSNLTNSKIVPFGGLFDLTEKSTHYELYTNAFGDFNADGKLDVVIAEQGSQTRHGVSFAEINADGIPEGFYRTNCKGSQGYGFCHVARDYTRLFISNLDLTTNTITVKEKVLDSFENRKDGKYLTYDNQYSLLNKLHAQDLNGDGLTDFIVQRDVDGVREEGDQQYNYRINTGIEFKAEQALFHLPYDSEPLFMDYNRDGAVDVVWNDDVKNELLLRRWTANKLDENTIRLLGTSGDDKAQHMLLDLTGDGRLDYLKRDEDYLTTVIALQDGDAVNVIDRFRNGLGAITEIAYESMAQTPNYSRLQLASNAFESCDLKAIKIKVSNGTRNVSAKYRDSAEKWCSEEAVADLASFYRKLNGEWDYSAFGSQFDLPTKGLDKLSPVLEVNSPMQIVTRVSSSAPTEQDNNAMSSVSYLYSQAQLQAAGRGMLGFASLMTIDEQSGVHTTTQYRQDFPFNGRPIATTVTTESGALISRSVNNWQLKGYENNWSETAKAQGSASLGWLQPYLASSIEQSFDPIASQSSNSSVPLNTVNTNFNYDDFGNVLTSKVRTNWGASEHVQSTENKYGDSNVSFNNSLHSLNSFKELGRLTESTVTTNGKDRFSAFTYYQNGAQAGLLQTETVEPDNVIYGTTTTHLYDDNGNKTQSTVVTADTEDRTSKIVFDDDRRYVQKSINGFNQVTQEIIERNALGQPTKVKDIAGNISAMEYSAFGIKMQSSSADGASILTKIQPAGFQCQDRNASFQKISESNVGSKSLECFDKVGRSVRASTQSFNGDWVSVDTHYDNLSRVIKKSEPYTGAPGYWTTLTYDVLGRVTSTTLPDGNTMSVAYDRFTTTATNALGQQKIETKNGLGQLVYVEDNIGGNLKYNYDNQGNLKNVIREASEGSMITSMVYDDYGKKISMSDPDKGNWSYDYNALGEMVKQTSANGSYIITEYDRLGRKTARTDYSAQGVELDAAHWVFNNTQSTSADGAPQSALLSQYNSSGYKKSYQYDALGRASITVTELGDGQQHFERVTYDEFGRTHQIFDASGDGSWQNSGIEHNYNDYGFLRSVVDATIVNGSPKHEYYQVLSMDERGNVTESLSGNGVHTEREFDDTTGRLSSIYSSHGFINTIQELEYQWDEIGNLIDRKELSGNKNLTETFTYDGLNRVRSATADLPVGQMTTELQYDGFGNIRLKSDVGQYFYDDDTGSMVSNLLRKVDDQSYSYDANGNVTSYEGKTLEYSVFDKPTRIQSKGHETTFKYGTARNRYERHDAYTDGKSKTTQYLGSVEKIQHSDGKLEFKRRLPGGALITLEQDSNNNILNETINYLHMDHLGSVDVITDAQGNIIQEMSFDLWGKRRDGTDWTKLGLLELSGFNADTTTRGYTGHEMLDEVGLIHMNGRVYDPRLGRFIQADSIIDGVSNTQGYGRYTYVKNNPLNATDPTGHFSLKRFVKKYWKPLVVVGLSIATYGAATSWAAGWGATWGTAATATSAATLTASGAMAVGAISGAVGGFAGGVLQAGTLRGGVKGAVSGAIAGAAGGYANFGSVGGWGDAARRVGISAVGGCGAGVASGGSCSKGARMAAMAQAVSVGIEKFSSKPTLGTPENKNGVYKLSDDKVRNQNHCFTCDVADTNSNNIGIGVRSQNANQVLGAATPDSGWLSFNEGSVASRGLAHVPGFNSGAVFHDTFVGTLERSVGMQNWSSSAQTFGGLFTNQLTIAPAIALNYYATGVQSYNYYWDNIE